MKKETKFSELFDEKERRKKSHSYRPQSRIQYLLRGFRSGFHILLGSPFLLSHLRSISEIGLSFQLNEHILRHIRHCPGKDRHSHENHILEADEEPDSSPGSEVDDFHGETENTGIGDHGNHGGHLQDHQPGADVFGAHGNHSSVEEGGEERETLKK
jgi:hypothetical protein